MPSKKLLARGQWVIHGHMQRKRLSALRARDCSGEVSLGHMQMQSNGLLMRSGNAHKGSVYTYWVLK